MTTVSPIHLDTMSTQMHVQTPTNMHSCIAKVPSSPTKLLEVLFSLHRQDKEEAELLIQDAHEC